MFANQETLPSRILMIFSVRSSECLLMTVLPKGNWVATLLADNKLTTAINKATAIGE